MGRPSKHRYMQALDAEFAEVRERGWRLFPLGVKLSPWNETLRLCMPTMRAAHSLRALVTGGRE